MQPYQLPIVNNGDTLKLHKTLLYTLLCARSDRTPPCLLIAPMPPVVEYHSVM
jgi:hypothetical protein